MLLGRSSWRFQSLIGRLQTILKKFERGGQKLFQSLIGRLQTAFEWVVAEKAFEVSIPHR